MLYIIVVLLYVRLFYVINFTYNISKIKTIVNIANLTSEIEHKIASWDIIAIQQPFNSISGDWFAFKSKNEDTYTIVLGDVVGHDNKSAAVASMLLGYFLGCPEEYNIIDLYFRLDMFLGSIQDKNSTIFSTIVIIQIESTGIINILNGGEVVELIKISKAGSSKTNIDITAGLIGQEFGGQYPKYTTLKLKSGQFIIITTDGWRNPSDEDDRTYVSLSYHPNISISDTKIYSGVILPED